MFLPLSIVRSLPADVPLYLDLLHRELAFLVPDRNGSRRGLYVERVGIVVPVVVVPVVTHDEGFMRKEGR